MMVPTGNQPPACCARSHLCGRTMVMASSSIPGTAAPCEGFPGHPCPVPHLPKGFQSRWPLCAHPNGQFSPSSSPDDTTVSGSWHLAKCWLCFPAYNHSLGLWHAARDAGGARCVPRLVAIAQGSHRQRNVQHVLAAPVPHWWHQPYVGCATQPLCHPNLQPCPSPPVLKLSQHHSEWAPHGHSKCLCGCGVAEVDGDRVSPSAAHHGRHLRAMGRDAGHSRDASNTSSERRNMARCPLAPAATPPACQPQLRRHTALPAAPRQGHTQSCPATACHPDAQACPATMCAAALVMLRKDGTHLRHLALTAQ